MSDLREELRGIKTFPSLVKFLRDELDWPITTDDFEEATFDYSPEELGLNPAVAAKIGSIKRLRPLTVSQPWGVFFVDFEPKRLPVVALRRILNAVVTKKRTSGNRAERVTWVMDDLMFISAYGEGDARQINFAHFSRVDDTTLPELRVLGWDNRDTLLHMDAVADTLSEKLAWPSDEGNTAAWRDSWSSAFALRHREVITTSQELAIRLAALARAIRDRILGALDVETEDGRITGLLQTFREVLVHDLSKEAFSDMYAQTIAYGLLSARITNPTALAGRGVGIDLPVTNPFLRELMEEFLASGERQSSGKRPDIDFDELGINEVIALLDDADMEAVVRDFGDRNPDEDPVIHFYELFLNEFDQEEKKRRGVFYTPRPIVSYIVRSVDWLLRSEFGLVDGLADTTTWGEMKARDGEFEIPDGVASEQAFVQILDPATGTGTFLVEVIDVIHQTLMAKWRKKGYGEAAIRGLWNQYVPKSLLPRLFGYELLMAPYAVAHLKIGLKLYETGYRFASDERARIYLTNALEPAHDTKDRFEFAIPALAHEAQEVNAVKRDHHFTVVLGNPPYSKISANLTPEMRAIVERYRFSEGSRIKERGALQFEINLQDDYVKFFRLCEINLLKSGVGVLGLITNNGYLTTPTLRGMRDSLLETFDVIRVLNLHGHIAKGETGPDGSPEQNVFDILQGVSVLVGHRKPGDAGIESVFLDDCFGTRDSKYAYLQSHDLRSIEWRSVAASRPMFAFADVDLSLESEWREGIGLTELFPVNSAGVITARDGLVISEDSDALAERLAEFAFDGADDPEVYERFGFSASKRFDLRDAQADLRNSESFSAPIRPVLYRPFDRRFLFYHPSVVWSLARPVADRMVGGDNIALIATRQVTRPQFEHVFISKNMIEIKACSHDRNTQIFPLFAGNAESELGLESEPANVNLGFFNRQASLLSLAPRLTSRDLGDDDELTPLCLLQYVYAILHSPRYRYRYFDFLKTEFPRIPSTSNASLFRSLCKRGSELIGCHLLEYEGVFPASPSLVGAANPRVEKVSYSDKTVWLDARKTVGFAGVEPDVWEMRVGGYQVCHKWLKDRGPKRGNLGRVLTEGDIEHYQKIVGALSKTIRIMSEIDHVIDAHGGWPDAFRGADRDEGSSA